MMSRRALVSALALPALLVAGCSSSGSSGSSPSTSASSGAASSSSAPTSPAARALAARMRTGLAGLTSAHVEVDAGALGGKSGGDFAFVNGKSTASDIVVDPGEEKTQIITVGTTSYAKLPAGRNTSGKPWVKVSATSKNEFVRALASTLDLAKAAGSLPAVVGIIATATSVQDKGTAALGHHYALIVDPARSSGTTLGTLLGDIGQQQIPIQLYLDAKNRPVDVVIAVKLGSQSFDVTIAVSGFNEPVHITAPPASQVSSN